MKSMDNLLQYIWLANLRGKACISISLAAFFSRFTNGLPWLCTLPYNPHPPIVWPHQQSFSSKRTSLGQPTYTNKNSNWKRNFYIGRAKTHSCRLLIFNCCVNISLQRISICKVYIGRQERLTQFNLSDHGEECMQSYTNKRFPENRVMFYWLPV